MIAVALDTNVLAYAEDTNGPAMKRAALELVEKLPPDSTMIPAQAMGELYNVLVRKAGWPPSRARRATTFWGDTYPVIETSPPVILAAIDLAADARLRIWDAVVLASAADAGCRLLLSEDLQDGFSWSGVVVTNPFLPSRHPLLDAMLNG